MKISVYITTYNKEKYLCETIDSVLAQTLQPHEIIIVDDGSQDDSREIIQSYVNRFPESIIPVLNEQNLGIAACRNIALKRVIGEVVTYLDGDDIFYRDKLLSEYEILSSKKDLSVVYSNFNYITSSGEEIGSFSEDNNQPVTGNIFKETLLRQYNVTSGNNYIYEMFYKYCAQDIGFYDQKIKIWEDWDFRIRMSKKFQYGYCPDVNSAYRRLGNGLHNSEPELHYREQIKIYNKNKHLMSSLEAGEKKVIYNRIYSWLKISFVKLIKSNIHGKRYIRLIEDSFHFFLPFKGKETKFETINASSTKKGGPDRGLYTSNDAVGGGRTSKGIGTVQRSTVTGITTSQNPRKIFFDEKTNKIRKSG